MAAEVEDNHEVVKETAYVLKENKQLVESPRDSLNSTTRIRTTNFSHNGYSEEIFKISQHVPSLGLGAEDQRPNEEAY